MSGGDGGGRVADVPQLQQSVRQLGMHGAGVDAVLAVQDVHVDGGDAQRLFGGVPCAVVCGVGAGERDPGVAGMSAVPRTVLQCLLGK